MLADHKQPNHHYERISEIEEKQKNEIEQLVTECKGKMSLCEEATSTLQNSLSELQVLRDDAKSLIQETFQTYKAMLESQRVKFHIFIIILVRCTW